jgi:arylsulfatase A-like enzyme
MMILSVAVVFCPAAGAEGALRPNILWITCEDMSPNLGCYGDRFAVTPNLDGLSSQSVRYTRAFATAPVCTPSRACLITGVYATTLGNAPLRCPMSIPPFIQGYAAYLREAGYFTSNNVKTDYNLQNERAFIRQAWDSCDDKAHWRQRKPGQPFFSIFNLVITHQGYTSVNSWEQFEQVARRHLAPGERSDPAKVPVPPYYPDTPLARRTLARYYDCIRIMDQQAGKHLQQLNEDGLAEETIVFFYSDHGMGLPRGKRTLFDSGLNVPLMVRFPRKYAHLAPAQPGQTVDRLVSFVDFAPTVLSLAGLPVPGHMQGSAFLGPAAGDPRELIFGARDRVDEAYDLSRSVRDGRWLYIRNYMPHLSWMPPEGYSDGSEFRRELKRLAREGKLAAGPMTYAAPTRAIEELYDTASDPQQIENLASRAEHAPVLERMRRVHRQWVLSTRDLQFVPEQQLFERIGDRTPYDFGQNRASYPLERILETADMVGRPGATSALAERLQDADMTVRYWALVGLRAAGRDALAARDRIAGLLHDRSPAVRVEAAGVLVALNDTAAEPALDILVQALRSEDRHAALHAGRTLQLLGERARPAGKAIREVRDGLPERDGAFAIVFSLRNALNGWLQDD